MQSSELKRVCHCVWAGGVKAKKKIFPATENQITLILCHSSNSTFIIVSRDCLSTGPFAQEEPLQRLWNSRNSSCFYSVYVVQISN